MLVPSKALIVVADGTHAKFFRNTGTEQAVHLTAEGEVTLKDFHNDGPAGVRPKDTSPHEMEQATFAKHLAHDLTRRAQGGEFDALVLIVDPQTLGEIRPLLHKEVQSRIIGEFPKNLGKAPIADIEKALA